MISQLKVWKLLQKNLAEGKAAMLLTVPESSGSSPGRRGFSLALDSSGTMEGSIGGGLMEFRLCERAKLELKRHAPAANGPEAGEAGVATAAGTLSRQVHDKNAAANPSGMICSGEQSVLLYRAGAADRAAVDTVVQTLEADGVGLLTMTPHSLHFAPAGVRAAEAQPEPGFDFSGENDWEFREILGYRNRLHLVGGGHCALALSRLMAGLDFYVSLYEDRPGLNTLQKNVWVNKKTILPTYADLGSILDSDPAAYVVLMTFGYKTDDLALRSIIDKDFRYLGMMGSKSKIAKLFEDYRAEGIPAERLARVRAPIGLDIKSHSPEEIAVSVAAEIIKVKNSTES